MCVWWMTTSLDVQTTMNSGLRIRKRDLLCLSGIYWVTSCRRMGDFVDKWTEGWLGPNFGRGSKLKVILKV